MHDQADELRQLVLRASQSVAARPAAADSDRPILVAVAGAKGGVGTTTVSVNLAVEMTRQGKQVVLVDANLGSADATALCGLADDPGALSEATPPGSVADVLAARRSVHEVLRRGPQGLLVLPGVWTGGEMSPGDLADCAPSRQRRLIAELMQLQGHVDYVVLDVGSGLSNAVRRFWEAADCVLMVTTPDDVAVMDAYATLKVLLPSLNATRKAPCEMLSVVNMLVETTDAEDVQARLVRACHRFLGLTIRLAGAIVEDQSVREAARTRRPFVVQSPRAPAAQSMRNIAEALLAVTADDTNHKIEKTIQLREGLLPIVGHTQPHAAGR